MGPSSRSRAAYAIGAAVSLAAALFGRHADALDVDPRVHLTYEAPPECPDERAFLAEIRERMPQFEPVREGDSARVFAVELAPTPMDTVVGRLTATVASERPAAREVEGSTCQEVARALAFIVAMTVDPDAAEPPPSSPPAPPDRARAPTPERPAGLQLAAGAGGSAVAGVAPGALPVLQIFVEARLQRPSLLSPSVRLAGERGSTGHFDVGSAGSAAFTWTFGSLELCPGRWTAGPFAVLPCARAALGALSGEGANIAQPHDSTRFWFDLGAVVRGRWVPLEPLFLEVEGGAVFPLWRDQFHFDSPQVGIHTAASVAGMAGADVGARFW